MDYRRHLYVGGADGHGAEGHIGSASEGRHTVVMLQLVFGVGRFGPVVGDKDDISGVSGLTFEGDGVRGGSTLDMVKLDAFVVCAWLHGECHFPFDSGSHRVEGSREVGIVGIDG